ncbi:hypothetical protein DFH07DRAFT_935786 [Mycena maculata]|uniref:Uncharacterized protein n=1 Tax=Mycena maculata TaxID=230809 RepID=A0AAD7KB71_9AGAR|nr:hypothetical protein DFH07DRAFT_935786 [Mycena maculata]
MNTAIEGEDTSRRFKLVQTKWRRKECTKAKVRPLLQRGVFESGAFRRTVGAASSWFRQVPRWRRRRRRRILWTSICLIACTEPELGTEEGADDPAVMVMPVFKAKADHQEETEEEGWRDPAGFLVIRSIIFCAVCTSVGAAGPVWICLVHRISVSEMAVAIRRRWKDPRNISVAESRGVRTGGTDGMLEVRPGDPSGAFEQVGASSQWDHGKSRAPRA